MSVLSLPVKSSLLVNELVLWAHSTTEDYIRAKNKQKLDWLMIVVCTDFYAHLVHVGFLFTSEEQKKKDWLMIAVCTDFYAHLVHVGFLFTSEEQKN